MWTGAQLQHSTDLDGGSGQDESAAGTGPCGSTPAIAPGPVPDEGRLTLAYPASRRIHFGDRGRSRY